MLIVKLNFLNGLQSHMVFLFAWIVVQDIDLMDLKYLLLDQLLWIIGNKAKYKKWKLEEIKDLKIF